MVSLFSLYHFVTYLNSLFLIIYGEREINNEFEITGIS